MPQYWVDTLSDLVNMPISSGDTKAPQYLGGLATMTPGGPEAATVFASNGRHHTAPCWTPAPLSWIARTASFPCSETTQTLTLPSLMKKTESASSPCRKTV
jgi:hypothetical protein